jgi:hypothetical protein
MSIKEIFFSSFIKGIGKTTGTVTILGFLGCAWYIQMNYFVKQQVKVQEKEKEKEKEQEQEQEQDQDQEMEDLEFNTKEERNYKKIFENL